MTRFFPAFPPALLALLLGAGRRTRTSAPAPARTQRHQDVRALAAMSDHELKDLGIGRSQIPGLARAARPRDYIGL